MYYIRIYDRYNNCDQWYIEDGKRYKTDNPHDAYQKADEITGIVVYVTK